MDIKQLFTFESSIIPPNIVFSLNENILDDLYSTSNIVEKYNVFFHLQNNFFYFINNKMEKEAAYICYLISYYLFVPLTPPHSDILAYEFAKKAIELDPKQKYINWLDEVKNGN